MSGLGRIYAIFTNSQQIGVFCALSVCIFFMGFSQIFTLKFGRLVQF